jgi:hypothetical protein
MKILKVKYEIQGGGRKNKINAKPEEIQHVRH